MTMMVNNPKTLKHFFSILRLMRFVNKKNTTYCVLNSDGYYLLWLDMDV